MVMSHAYSKYYCVHVSKILDHVTQCTTRIVTSDTRIWNRARNTLRLNHLTPQSSLKDRRIANKRKLEIIKKR